MVYDAFISYRRSDRITADGVARFLDAFGLTVFVDRSSRAGTNWEPELRAALASAKVLVVLWSRSAAQSAWVEQEWRNVPRECRVVPIKLDGEKLPDELRRLTAVEGLDVGSRLLQRSFELMQQGGLAPSQAQAQLVRELAADGVVLEPKKHEALGIFLGFLSGLAASAALDRIGNTGRTAATDSLPPSSTTTAPPPAGGGRTRAASFLSVLGIGGAAVFCIGYWAAPRAPATATQCPPAPSAAPSGPGPLGECACSRKECESGAAALSSNSEMSNTLTRLRDKLQSCEQGSDALAQQLGSAKHDLSAYRSMQPAPPPPPLVATAVPFLVQRVARGVAGAPGTK